MLEQLNVSLFNMINQFAGRNFFIDETAIICAKYMPFLFILILAYLWLKNKKDKNILLHSFYAAVFGLGINFLISKVYFHPRPFMVRLGTALFHYASDSSFPSDHTTIMLSIAMIMLFYRDTYRTGALLAVLGIVGGMARVFSGVHFPFDIFGSIIVSCISASAIYLSRSWLVPINARVIDSYFFVLKKIRSSG